MYITYAGKQWHKYDFIGEVYGYGYIYEALFN